MRGSSVGTEGRIGAAEEVFCSMQFFASINHGGCRCPMVAMRPYSWSGSMQQSFKMLGKSSLLMLNS